ncbi:MAG: hypothetical protein K6F76_04260 [Clostridiales bacterium]|nr:hypothetical protein [Clostridiales bacterium]
MKTIVYAYIMTHDTGFAPAIKDNVLSLACCKTNLRYTIGKKYFDEKNDPEDEIYVIGICGKKLADRNKDKISNSDFPVFVAKINKVIPVEKYYSDKTYKKRPDAQYRYEKEKWFFTKDNPHHVITNGEDVEELNGWREEKDLRYINGSTNAPNYVLLSNCYLYFGKSGDYSTIKSHLNNDKILKSFDKSRIGHRIIPFNDNEVKKLVNYISSKENREKFSKQKDNTIDKYFLNKKCSSERKCR